MTVPLGLEKGRLRSTSRTVSTTRTRTRLGGCEGSADTSSSSLIGPVGQTVKNRQHEKREQRGRRIPPITTVARDAGLQRQCLSQWPWE